jgi:SnoaL-like domain
LAKYLRRNHLNGLIPLDSDFEEKHPIVPVPTFSILDQTVSSFLEDFKSLRLLLSVKMTKTDLEKIIRKLEDVETIKELKEKYWYCLEYKLWDDLGDLFIEDVIDYLGDRRLVVKAKRMLSSTL